MTFRSNCIPDESTLTLRWSLRARNPLHSVEQPFNWRVYTRCAARNYIIYTDDDGPLRVLVSQYHRYLSGTVTVFLFDFSISRRGLSALRYGDAQSRFTPIKPSQWLRKQKTTNLLLSDIAPIRCWVHNNMTYHNDVGHYIRIG